MKRRVRGLSLVEVMVATTVLALVLLAFLSMMYSSSQMSASSRETTVASSIIQSTAEDLFAMQYSSFWESYFADPDKTGGIFRMLVEDGVYKDPDAYQLDKYRIEFPATNRLKDEKIYLYMVPTSDIASESYEFKKHGWVDFKFVVQWTDSRGKAREESIISRRSQ